MALCSQRPIHYLHTDYFDLANHNSFTSLVAYLDSDW